MHQNIYNPNPNILNVWCIKVKKGTIAFGLGTLIYTGLEFVHFFEIPFGCSSWHILSGTNPALHMVFTFMQMYYLFMHSRLNINKNKIIAKFGLMHLLVGSYLSN